MCACALNSWSSFLSHVLTVNFKHLALQKVNSFSNKYICCLLQQSIIFVALKIIALEALLCPKNTLHSGGGREAHYMSMAREANCHPQIESAPQVCFVWLEEYFK